MTKHDQILETATKLFIEYGFHATPTSKIAKEAGVSNGTLFHYFPTKEELVSALYLSIKADLRLALLENLETQNTIKQMIYQVWLNWVNWGLEHQNKFMFIELFSNSPYIHTVSKEEASKAFEFSMDILNRGMDEDVLIRIHPKLMGMLVYGSVNTTVRFSMINTKTLDDSDLEKMFGLLWRSIANI
jgi:AcrR family transcriptional regulator